MNIYKEIVEVNTGMTITSCGVNKQYICGESSPSNDYSITLPTTDIADGDLLYFLGASSLTKVVKIGTEYLSANNKLELEWVNGDWKRLTPRILESNRTIYLNNTMTQSEIQTIINTQPKNLNGYVLTFQFADGTYTIPENTDLKFQRFNGGQIVIFGNQTESSSTNHTDQAVIFQTTRSVDMGSIYIENCHGTVYIANIRVQTTSTSWGHQIVAVSGGFTQISGCSFECSTRNGSGFWSWHGESHLERCTFTSHNVAIGTEKGCIASMNNNTSGDGANIGLRAYGGIIEKNGTQPSGSELADNGGVIR